MPKDLKSIAVRLMAVGAAACSSVYAAQSAPDIAYQPVPEGTALPTSHYTVDLLDETGRELDTYQKGDRFYVLGAAGTRYSIRVTNPTDRRVEALISVDGLDVVDGEDADFKSKRGYIVPPHDVLLVAGFRTSDSEVASFRFSSVADSYANRKGKGRNVGVVGVAIFEETAGSAIILGDHPRHRRGWPEERWDDLDRHPPAGADMRGAPTEKDAVARTRPQAAPAEPRFDGAGGEPTPAAPPRASSSTDTTEATVTCCGQRTSRPGLGTAWGERRWSAITFTRFTRRNPTRPDAVAELRYNDAGGLAAMGIVTRPAYDEGEVAQRETADPFPGAHFAEPPR